MFRRKTTLSTRRIVVYTSWSIFRFCARTEQFLLNFWPWVSRALSFGTSIAARTIVGENASNFFPPSVPRTNKRRSRTYPVSEHRAFPPYSIAQNVTRTSVNPILKHSFQFDMFYIYPSNFRRRYITSGRRWIYA